MTRQAGRLSSRLQKTLFNKSENRFIGSFDAFKGPNIKKELIIYLYQNDHLKSQALD